MSVWKRNPLSNESEGETTSWEINFGQAFSEWEGEDIVEEQNDQQIAVDQQSILSEQRDQQFEGDDNPDGQIVDQEDEQIPQPKGRQLRDRNLINAPNRFGMPVA